MNRRVLFLCTGNSCRSQMAEAIVNARLGESWEAHSAGSRPAAAVHPLALKVLEEIGIVHDGRPKAIAEFQGQTFDRVITLCDDAAEACLVWLGGGVRQHVGLPDPALAIGSEDEVLETFRSVRDDIEGRILPLLRAA